MSAEGFTFFGKGNGLNTIPFGESISVRPYTAPNYNVSPPTTVQGFLKFRTLGGYDQNDTGAPTAAQINKSLFNAMKLFYNVKEGGSSTAEGSLGSAGTNVSASISADTLKNIENTNFNPNLYALTPKERAINSITGEDSNGNSAVSNDLRGGKDEDFYEVYQEPYSSGAIAGPYRVKIVRLLDTTTVPNVFLGYGLKQQSNESVSNGGAGYENYGCTAKCNIGSYFNPNEAYFANPSDYLGQVEFDISETTIDDIPLLVFNQASSFDGTEDGDDTTSSVTSSSASVSIDIGNNTSISGESTINPNYSFYTY